MRKTIRIVKAGSQGARGVLVRQADRAAVAPVPEAELARVAGGHRGQPVCPWLVDYPP